MQKLIRFDDEQCKEEIKKFESIEKISKLKLKTNFPKSN